MEEPIHHSKTTTSTDKLLHYWYRLLAKRQYTRTELIKKAQTKQYDSNTIGSALKTMENQGLLKDEIVVDGLMTKYSGNKGKNALMLQMRKKGIDESLQKNARNTFQETLSNSLLRVIERRFQFIDNKQERKMKIVRFLASRGYTAPFDLYNEVEKKFNW